jgi:NAD(P)-dependent dehydrogenase (short-subunit alcohol dehydrogenase family)
MRGKVVVITGATSGIGQAAAEKLVTMGARLVLVVRDQARAEATLARLRELGPGAAATVHYADLLRLSEMKRVAGEIAAAEARIDVLINNAGALFSRRHISQDGLEFTFALNHMSYFVLTHQLLHRLRASAPARIVNTASDAHEAATLDFEDLQSAKVYGKSDFLEWLRFGGPGFKVYGRSKLCNILFTRELARRITGTGVTANALHPGFVATRFGDQSGGLISFGIKIGKRFALSPEKGAETLVYLASSPEVAAASGGYYYKCRLGATSKSAQDDAAARRLWAESAKLAALPED